MKIEIGSSVRLDPYSKKILKSYIQEFLEENGGEDDIYRFELENVSLNVLNIERTFVDKLMSVKRHTMCGNSKTKVRHIYDVVKLFGMPEITQVQSIYENLHKELLYTDEQQSFNEALYTFEKINDILKEIEE